MRAGVLALSVVAAWSCAPRPVRRPPVPDPPPPEWVAIEIAGERLQAEWIRTDPARRHPLYDRRDLPEGRAILVGFPVDRFQHYYGEYTLIALDVLFLDAAGRVVSLQGLPLYSEGGVTSAVEARYAFFLPLGWAARRGVRRGDAVALPPEVAARPPEPMMEVRAGGTALRVESASDKGERARGLMFRPELSKDEGMLFIYPEARPLAFYMLNTLLPLDIAYFDGGGRLLNVVSVDPPPSPGDDDGARYPSKGDAQFVLETHKGWFRARGLADEAGLPAGEIRLELPPAARRLVEAAE